MPSIITKAEDYLTRVEKGYYTELGEGERLLKEAVFHLKTFIVEEPTQEASTAPVGEATAEQAPDEANDPVLIPTPEAPEGTEAAPGEIPAEAGLAPETTSAPDEAAKA